MRPARIALVLAAAPAAAAFGAKAQDGDVVAGHAFAREACKACHMAERKENDRHRAGVPRDREHSRDDGNGHAGLPYKLAPQDAKPHPHPRGDRGSDRVYPESPRSSLSRRLYVPSGISSESPAERPICHSRAKKMSDNIIKHRYRA